jgi:hypothetical protein
MAIHFHPESRQFGNNSVYYFDKSKRPLSLMELAFSLLALHQISNIIAHSPTEF